MKFCDLSCSNKQDFLTSSAIREVISQLQNKYSEYWNSKINSSTRLEFFTRIKQSYEQDPFLNEVKIYDVKRNIINLEQVIIPCALKQVDIVTQ